MQSNGALTGFIYSFGASGNPYGFPSWHTGLVQATQPWSGHYYVTPALWSMAHINQFVQPGWQFTQVGHGSGTLANGGFYTTWVNTGSAQKQFVLVVAKMTGADSDPTTAETATFTLGGSLAGLFNGNQLYQWYSQFGYYITVSSALVVGLMPSGTASSGTTSL